jgi:hypothetical protein
MDYYLPTLFVAMMAVGELGLYWAKQERQAREAAERNAAAEAPRTERGTSAR